MVAQRLECRAARDRQAGRLGEAEGYRLRGRRRLLDDRALGVAPAALQLDERDDRIARLEPRHARTDRGDLARDVTAGDIGESQPQEQPQLPLADLPVDRIHRGRPDVDLDLAGARHGVGTLIQPQPIKPAVTVDDDGFHPSVWPPR